MNDPSVAQRLGPALGDDPAAMAAIIDALPDAVFVYDPDWRMLLANRAAVTLFQITEDVKGRHISRLARLRGRPFTDEARLARIADSAEERALAGAVDDLELGDSPLCLRRSSAAVWASPAGPRAPQERPLAFVVIYHDITLLTRAQARAETQTRVAAALNASASLEATLSLAVRELRLAIGGDRAAIALCEDEAAAELDKLSFAATDGSTGMMRAETALRPADYPLSGAVLRTAQPQFAIVAAESPSYQRHGFRAGLALPLRVENTILGLAYVGWTELRPAPDAAEMAFMQTLADLCAAAIARMRRAAERERAQRLAGALNTAMTRALDAPDEDDMLAAFGSTLEELGLHLQMGLWDTAREQLTPRYSSTAPDLRAGVIALAGRSFAGAVAPAGALASLVPGDDLSTAALLETAALLRAIAPDLAAPLPERIVALLDSPHTVLAPLRASGEALGECAVLGRLRPDDVPLVQAWADALAGLLMQRRLFASAHEYARRQATLMTITADLAGVQEPQAVLERAVDAAAELLGAQSVAGFLRRADGDGFDAAAARGLAPLEPGTPALSMEESIAGRSVQDNTLYTVTDAAVERTAGIAFPRLAGDLPVGAVLVAPIAEEAEEPAGVLEVYAAAPRRWPEEDQALLRALAAACAVALRGARERTRARRNVARSHALAALSAALYAAEDADAVLHLLVQGACNALDASRAILVRPVTLHSPTITHEYGAPGMRPLAELVSTSESILWARMLTHAELSLPIVVDDVDADTELRARWAAVGEEQRPRAILAAPLVDAERLAGIVILHHCGHPRHWDAEEIAFVRTLAAQAGVALRQRHLVAITRTDAQRLATLNRVAEAMIGVATFGAMCDRALAALAEVLDAAAGAIHVYDETAPADRALRMVAWRGISEDVASAWTALPLGVGLGGQAALHRAIVAAERLTETPPAAGETLQLARQERMEARAAVPMLARGRLLGVVTIACHEARAWSEADLSLLQTVANQLAAALEAEELRSAAAAAAAAREADRLKSELLSTVSHELRTPLGAIKGFASGLLHYGEQLDAAQYAESLRAIDQASDQLTELIDNLLDLQRLEAGRLSVARSIVDLAEVATAVVRETTARASSSSHTLGVVAGPGAFLVQGDVRRLRQVIQNLVENALKYSPGGGRVVARLTAKARTIELRVEDDGIGIPPDQLALIFDRFHRVDSSMTRRIGGTGLGLAIVKGLIVAHGGAIRAESAGEGHGSSIVITLPRAEGGDDDGG